MSLREGEGSAPGGCLWVVKLAGFLFVSIAGRDTEGFELTKEAGAGDADEFVHMAPEVSVVCGSVF